MVRVGVHEVMVQVMTPCPAAVAVAGAAHVGRAVQLLVEGPARRDAEHAGPTGPAEERHGEDSEGFHGVEDCCGEQGLDGVIPMGAFKGLGEIIGV